MTPLRDENGAASRSGVSGGERAWRTEPDAGRDRVNPSKNERPGMFCIGCVLSQGVLGFEVWREEERRE